MNRQLVISGMHRSGTSLVTSVLRVAGVDIGRDVIPGVGNPRGHFEDLDFQRLHEAMLAASGGVWRSVDAGVLGAPAELFARRARRLIAARSRLPLWGWKDPRTCLFLPFWNELLPGANYLFTYRHVVDVMLSLWRRGRDPELRSDPWLAIRAWTLYNRSILDFCERHRERCFLAHVPALTGDLPGLIRRVADRFDLPLRADGVEPRWEPGELEPPTEGTGVAWEALIPEALAVYQLLEARADVSSKSAGSRVIDNRPPPLSAVELRDRELLCATEILLHDLLVLQLEAAPLAAGQPHKGFLAEAIGEEQRRRWDLTVALGDERRQRQLITAALGEERARREELERALVARLAEVSAALTAIESSSAFVPVRMWWRLRRRFFGPRNGEVLAAATPAPGTGGEPTC